jgi:SET domain-containing protein
MARYANDAKGIGRVEGLKNNSQYEIKTRQGEKRVFIVATRTIKANDEVLVDYGKDYWKNLSKANDLKAKVKSEINKIQKKAKKK